MRTEAIYGMYPTNLKATLNSLYGTNVYHAVYESRKGIKMKSRIMLQIENNRLKRRNAELETKIERINQMNDKHLYLLHRELETLLVAVREKTL